MKKQDMIKTSHLKGQEIFVGLEDSKKSWKICVRSQGVVVNETTMPASYQNLKNYFNNKFPDCKINVIYEAGFKGFNLHDSLVADSHNCIVTPPHTVTDEKCQRNKNDRIDCRRLSKNLENNDYKTCYVPDREERENRQVTRSYAQIQKNITRVCNRIRRELEFHGLDHNFKSGRWYRSDYLYAKGFLKELNLSFSLNFSFEIKFKELEFLWDLQKEVLSEIRNLAKSEKYKESVNIFMSCPGIGLLTAIRLVLEWGDVTRFKRKEEFAKFTGLIPSDYSTGESERTGHITKQGNRFVRGWLIESAWVAIRKDPILLDKFNRVMGGSPKRKKMAIVAVAKTLALRLRSLLINKENYIIGLVA